MNPITQNYDAVIFDLDGTLYDKKRLPIYMMFKLWKDLKILSTANKIRKNLKGKEFDNPKGYFEFFYSSIADSISKPVDYVEHWYTESFYPGFIHILNKKYKGRENINEFLTKLNMKKPLAILSDYAIIEERLEVLGISREHFKIIGSSEEYGVLKPSARPLLEIAEKLGVSADRVLVVGDRIDTDGRAAELAGMMFYHISGKSGWSDFCREILKNI